MGAVKTIGTTGRVSSFQVSLSSKGMTGWKIIAPPYFQSLSLRRPLEMFRSNSTWSAQMFDVGSLSLAPMVARLCWCEATPGSPSCVACASGAPSIATRHPGTSQISSFMVTPEKL